MKSNPPRAGPSLTENPYSKLSQGNETGNVLVEESEGVGSQGLAESGKRKAESGKRKIPLLFVYDESFNLPVE